MKKYGMRIAAVVCMVIMCISLFPQMGQAAKKKESCKTLCGYALKATGGAKKLKYSSAAALDFGALTHSVRSQVNCNVSVKSCQQKRTGGIEEEIVGEAASWYLVVYCFCFGFCRLC